MDQWKCSPKFIFPMFQKMAEMLSLNRVISIPGILDRYLVKSSCCKILAEEASIVFWRGICYCNVVREIALRVNEKELTGKIFSKLSY